MPTVTRASGSPKPLPGHPKFCPLCSPVLLSSIKFLCILELLTWMGLDHLSCFSQESRLAKNEATGTAALVEVEKGCNLELSEKLKDAVKEEEDVPRDQMKPDQYSEALAQRDRWVSLVFFFVFPRRVHHRHTVPL